LTFQKQIIIFHLKTFIIKIGEKIMKKGYMIFTIILFFIFTVSLVFSENAEFRTTVSRNDASVSGEFHLDLEMRINPHTTDRTLNSLTADIYYGSELTEYASNPAISASWGPTLALGYTYSVNKNSGYYRILVTGGGVNLNEATELPGDPPGWDVTDSWKRVVTVRWTIAQATSVSISIDDGTDAGAYFDNYQNVPTASSTNWTMSNIDLGDVSLPVQMTNMSAQAIYGQGIELTWKTESEVNSTGFHIWKCQSKEGKYERITTELIPSHGNSSSANDYSFIDRNVQDGKIYWYKIEEISTFGESEYFGPINVAGTASVPTEFALSQNFPNPFNPETSFTYDIPEASDVSIKIYTLLGKEVKTLVQEHQQPGRYPVTWDTIDDSGQKVASGIYFLQMQAESFRRIRKMTVIR
jgi:hypothetical protein